MRDAVWIGIAWVRIESRGMDYGVGFEVAVLFLGGDLGCREIVEVRRRDLYLDSAARYGIRIRHGGVSSSADK